MTTILFHDTYRYHELLPNKSSKFGPKSQSTTNTVGLEQQIYASPEYFTPTLLGSTSVMEKERKKSLCQILDYLIFTLF